MMILGNDTRAVRWRIVLKKLDNLFTILFKRISVPSLPICPEFQRLVCQFSYLKEDYR